MGLYSAAWYPALLPSSACWGLWSLFAKDVKMHHVYIANPGAWPREVTTGLQAYPLSLVPCSHALLPVQVTHGIPFSLHHWPTESTLHAWPYDLVVAGSLLLISELAFFSSVPLDCAPRSAVC